MKKILIFFAFALTYSVSMTSYAEVKIVNTDDPEWCSYQQNCTYIRNVRCRTHRSNPKVRCERKIQKDALRAGADTVVYQSAQESGEQNLDDDAGPPDFVAYGLAYRCADLSETGKQMLDRINSKLAYRTQVVTAENEKRCDVKQDCKFLREFKCSTSRDRPELRCLKKIYKQARNSSLNKLVIKNEQYSPGKYRVYMDAYQCNFK